LGCVPAYLAQIGRVGLRLSVVAWAACRQGGC